MTQCIDISEARGRGLVRTAGRALRRIRPVDLFATTRKDMRRLRKLGPMVKALRHDYAFSRGLMRNIGKRLKIARGTGRTSARAITALKRELSGQSSTYVALRKRLAAATGERVSIIGRHAERAALAVPALTALGYGAKTRRKAAAMARRETRHREYDVYPRHGHAAAGATQWRQPFYLSGGRDEPKRSGPPRLGESLAARGSRMWEQRTAATPDPDEPETAFTRRMEKLPQVKIDEIEAIIRKSPKAWREYRNLRRMYAARTGLTSAFLTGLLVAVALGPRLGMALGGLSGVAAAAETLGGRRFVGRAHKKALSTAFQSHLRRGKYGRLMGPRGKTKERR